MVRQINPEAYTVAEFWQDAGSYLADCGFSATMNYHGFAYPVKGFLIDARLSASDFGRMIQQRMEEHAPAVRYALQNLVDSHDTPRIASMLVNGSEEKNLDYLQQEKFDYDIGERSNPRAYDHYDVSAPNHRQRQLQRLTALFQMTFVGAPMIYYGTEAGMDGADDPDDRMPMVWKDLDYEAKTKAPRGKRPGGATPVQFDTKLFEEYRQLIHLRRSHPALRRGGFQILATQDDHQMIAYLRSTPQERLIVALNRGGKRAALRIPLQENGLADAESLEPLYATGGKLTKLQAKKTEQDWRVILPARTGAIWKVSP
jgi:glycosidase